jgi:nucleoside-diphosphate-sugar epimerase
VKVLVMGGSRFNGLSLVEELVRAGDDVTVVNRGQSGGDLPESVRQLIADRTDHAQLRAVLAGEEFDCVQDVSAYNPDDVKVMIELLEGRVGHYVFVSSTVIYAPTDLLPITEDYPVDRSPAQSEYGLHKLLCEDLLVAAQRERGFPATVAALSMVFGPRNIVADREQRMMARLLAGRPVLVPGDGTTLAQVGYVEDQARALRMIMGQPSTFGRRYNLTGKQYFSDEGYVDTIGSVLGVEPQKMAIPAQLMDDLWDHRASLSGSATPAGADIPTSASRTGDAVIRQRYVLAGLIPRLAPNLHRWNRSVLFSIDRLRQDVGWVPELGFRDMVERTYEWFCRQPLAHRTRFDFTWEDELIQRVGDIGH